MSSPTPASRIRKSKNKQPTWPPILRRVYPSGKIAWMVTCQVNGERIRKTFKTKGEAEEEAALIRIRVENEGRAAFILPAHVRIEAARAADRLQPYGATITEAVDHYLEHVLKYRTAPTVNETIEKLIADAKRNHRRERTINDLHYRLAAFAATFGERRIAEITREELKSWLNNPSLSARSRINYATKLSQLWNFAVAEGWVENNPVTSIPRPDAEDTEPEIFTVDQAARLLEQAEKFGLLNYVLLGLFAGLRSAEIARLSWPSVSLAERVIIIGANVAKKRSRRVVSINDTLADWLSVSAKSRGQVMPFNSKRTLYARLAKLARAAGLDRWQKNGLRHSYASYLLALTRDAVRVAHELGNSSDMVHRHYKALVTEAQAKRFFALHPSKLSDTSSQVIEP